jgi:hypothetical protein
LPGSTLTMSMLIPFSASTMRVRWLHGSLGAEKSVMMDRLLDKIPLPRLQPLRAIEARARHALHWALQWTSFQYSFFKDQASQVNTSRNSTTHTPSERRFTWVGSPT